MTQPVSGSYHPHPIDLSGEATIPSGTPDRFERVDVLRDLSVPMRDGVHLAADVYLPRDAGPVPVIVTRLPYSKTIDFIAEPSLGEFWARKGFGFVCQDVRGRFASEGAFDPPCGRHEIDDGTDTIEWITRQPWSNGRVGMWGESYYGYTCWCGAMGGHPALCCIAPGNPIAFDVYNFAYRQGAFPFNAVGAWAIGMDGSRYNPFEGFDEWTLPLGELPDRMGLEGRLFKDWLAHPSRDAFWSCLDLTDGYAKIAVPTLLWGGWYDNIQGPWMEDWREICRQSPDARHKHLLVGPWDHEGTANWTGRIGPLQVGRHGAHRHDVTQAFFDHYLAQRDNGFDQRPRVEIFVMGDNCWRFEDDWPLTRAESTAFYLHSGGRANTLSGDGRLDRSEPDDEPPDSFTYDPEHPVTDTLYTDLWAQAAEFSDRREVEQREDVLVYTSEPFDADVEISGQVKALVHAASSAPDTDITATLVDVFEDGYALQIQHGIVRASFRDSNVEPSPLEPGCVYPFAIDLWWTSHVFKSGHRLRLEISSSRFDEFDRNLNRGEPSATARDPITAQQTVHHSALYPSRLVLPLVPR